MSPSQESGVVAVLAAEYRAANTAEREYFDVLGSNDPSSASYRRQASDRKRERVQGMELMLGMILGLPAYDRIRAAAKAEVPA